MPEPNILLRLISGFPEEENTVGMDAANNGALDVETSKFKLPSRDDVFLTILHSGLFDSDYYRSAGIHVDGDVSNLLNHFLDIGCDQNRRPNAYFEPQWYLSNYPDVGSVGVQPLYHYILHGDKEGRRPGPLFNTNWYRQEYNILQDQVALTHYLANCKNGTVSPLPEFDIAFYAKNYPDVIAAKIDPFEHFVAYGFREGRSPSADFNVQWYADRYLSGSLTENPFYHWLANRGKPGIFGRFPDDEPTVAREVKRFTRPADQFEEIRPLPRTARRKAKILAYYLPQFHPFEENDRWWGSGFTEWTNLPRGLPRFQGHFQPRVPRDLGFYRLDGKSVGDTLRKQYALAEAAGIHGFVFYHYWFNRKRLMAGPLEHLLADPSINLPFCLMWANENWTRRWDGAESEVLIAQDYRPEDDEAMLADFARHFRDPRYIRVAKRPVFMIYRPGVIPQTRETIARWRRLCQKRFGENPIFVMAQAFGSTDPRDFGFDGAVEFPPHKLTQHMPPINRELKLLDPEFSGNAYWYDAVVRTSLDEPEPSFPLIKTAVPSWDNDARRQGSGLVITGSTPAQYERWLGELVERAVRTPFFGEPMVCVNAWNEWCEGAYLEPDIHFGAAYLNATGRAVSGLSGGNAARTGRLVLVGHDAFPGGSQILLLKIGQALRRQHGVNFEYLLLDGGQMTSQYEAVAPTQVMSAGAGLDAAMVEIAARGVTRAIVNTTAAGLAAPALKRRGIDSILLVHELPRILREKNLLNAARQGLDAARLAVFAARFVRDALFKELGLSTHAVETLIMPQGSYKAISPSQEMARAFREQYAIREGEPLIVGVGYADLRKGFDIFLQLWRLLNRERRVHFCWLGDMDPALNNWLEKDIRLARASGAFHLPGQVADIVPALSAATAFALTSREDPYPTVALEAIAAGLPVVAFAESGGIPEMLVEAGAGRVVPYGDLSAMGEALEDMMTKPDAAAAAFRQTLARERFQFAPYVTKLLALAAPDLPRISVAVPNYNYARYMPERLGGIFAQTHPVHEVLMLDDCSKDDSLTVIPAIAADWGRDITLIANVTNSGSVFAQWRRAAETASGEWLWIAEADDNSQPDFLTRVMASIGNDPRVVLACSDSSTINSDGSPQWESYKSYYATIEPEALTRTEVFDGADFVARFLSVKNLLLNVSAVVWKRQALLDALDAAGDSLSTYKVAGDWRLYLAALSAPGARIAYEATPLNVHRRHADSMTHTLDADRHLEEITRCHALAATAAGSASDARREAQSTYLKEVAAYLGRDLVFKT